MIKIYEDFDGAKFRYKMICLNKIKDLNLHFLHFFEELDLTHFSDVSNCPEYGMYEIDFFKKGYYTNQYLCFLIVLTLTTDGVSDKHNVKIRFRLGNLSYCYDIYKELSLPILEFLAFNIDPSVKYYRDEFDFLEIYNIDYIDKIKSNITIDNYNIWLESRKYNL